MAEAIFKAKIEAHKLQDVLACDSAGIESYHVGENPDPRTMMVLNEQGIVGFEHKARKITEGDMDHYTYVVVMEKAVFNYCKDLLGGQPKMGLVYMGAFDPDMEGNTIKDPYHGSLDDFRDVYNRLNKCCDKLLETCMAKLQL
jgi:protein-tyrosine-phosphatase